jgi:hypothetical protein
VTALMEPILNELSLTPAPVPGPERLNRLVDVLTALVAEGVPRVLRYREGVLERPIDGELSFRRVCFDRLDRDRRAWLGTVLNKAPFVDELLAQAADGRLLEAKVQGEEAAGVCLAAVTEGLTVSLHGCGRFHRPSFNATLYAVDADGELHEDEVRVRNASEPAHVPVHTPWIHLRVETGVRSGEDLLQKAPELFPRVKFGPKAEKQVRALTGNELWFPVLLTHLRSFNAGAAAWTGRDSMPELDWSPEGPGTMAEFGSLRWFRPHDGGEARQMSNHSKIKAANIRIHFLAPDEVGEPLIVVGYVGKHLPTVRDRT